jgi:hypothetical protein
VNSYVDLLLETYVSKGLLVDANLLLLDVVGSFDVNLIGDSRFKKLAKYTLEDYKLLGRLKRHFRRVVTTPHVLTEVSNLTCDLPERTKIACLMSYPETFREVEELSFQSLLLFERSEFRFLGLTDAGLAQVCKEFLIVSDDARMCAKLNDAGLEALNFNYLRSYLFRS